MLGDLSVSEVEEFERHFFDCPQCSEELRVLTIFRRTLVPFWRAGSDPDSSQRACAGECGGLVAWVFASILESIVGNGDGSTGDRHLRRVHGVSNARGCSGSRGVSSICSGTRGRDRCFAFGGVEELRGLFRQDVGRRLCLPAHK